MATLNITKSDGKFIESQGFVFPLGDINLRYHFHAIRHFCFQRLPLFSFTSLKNQKTTLSWIFLDWGITKKSKWMMIEHFDSIRVSRTHFYLNRSRFCGEINFTDVRIHYNFKWVSDSRCDGGGTDIKVTRQWSDLTEIRDNRWRFGNKNTKRILLIVNMKLDPDQQEHVDLLFPCIVNMIELEVDSSRFNWPDLSFYSLHVSLQDFIECPFVSPASWNRRKRPTLKRFLRVSSLWVKSQSDIIDFCVILLALGILVQGWKVKRKCLSVVS